MLWFNVCCFHIAIWDGFRTLVAPHASLPLPSHDSPEVVLGRLLESPPPLLAGPLFQQAQLLCQVGGQTQLGHTREVVDEFLLGGEPFKDSQEVVPVERIGPGLKAGVPDVRIENSSNVEKSDVLDVDVVRY